ncbi:GNAT family N-acetyltransferase [Chloroflexota bacterium]
MSDRFSIAEYESRDWPQVQALLAAVYGRDSHKFHTQAEWSWRYHNGIYKSRIWLAKDQAGKVVALRPTVTRTVKIGDRYVPAVHFMDVMTHPDYRRRGLFAQLIHKATDMAIRQGSGICYSFPNENSFPGYARKTDWNHIGSFSLFMRPVNAEALLQESIGSRLLRKALAAPLRLGLSLVCRPSRPDGLAELSVRRLESFDQRFDAFWERVATDYEVVLRRDRQYLDWRYIQRPSATYTVHAAEQGEEILGFIVGRTWHMLGVNFGLIVDLLTCDQDQKVAQALVAEAVHDYTQDSADAIGCLMFDHQTYCQALRREGFIRMPKKLLPRRFRFMARVNQDDPALRQVLSIQDWYLAAGDNDAV